MDNKTLSQLSRAFSVKDIMTTARVLTRADSHAVAEHHLSDFDVVPYPSKGRIQGYFKRDNDELNSIERDRIVSDGTSLFDFTKLLQKSDFFFVLSGNMIIGYVHYSDLNKPLVKIPFFALSQGVERKLWDLIQDKISDDLIEEVFPDEKNRLIQKKRRAERNNIDLPWIGIFSFPYILKIARKLCLINLSNEKIDQLRFFRNRLAHSNQTLIHNKGDVQHLVSSQNLLTSLLSDSFRQ